MADRTKGFVLKKTGGLPYLQASLLSGSGLARHAFSTRCGGFSKGRNSSLNMAFHTGDEEETVICNRRRFMSRFGCDYRLAVSGIQVHGTKIAVVSADNCGEGALPRTARRKCDALITTEARVAITAYAADCQIFFILSLGRPLIALAHAGKKGALERMGGKVVDYICSEFQVQPEQLLVAMSPAICGRCYQVDEGTAEEFSAAGWGGKAYLSLSPGGGYCLDIGAVNEAQLLQAGIKKSNLALNRWCTSCNQELFYSYRRDKGATGRMIGMLALREGREEL